MTTMNTGKLRTVQLRNADAALWRRVKAAAALEGLSMTEWTENVIRKQIGDGKKQSPKAFPKQ